MSAITGQPAPKPKSLEKPVPGAEQHEDVTSFLSSFDPPSVPAAAPAGGADAFVNSFGGGEAPAPAAPQPLTPDQIAPEPGFVQANIDQFKPQNFIDRLATGLAANDNEKVGFLQKKYGNDNVSVKDDHIYFRRSKDEKFHRLDPKTLELIADTLPDFAREILTEGAMLPGEVGGAVMGSAAGPGGAAAGGLSGRVLSVPMANSLADSAASAMGVPQDPSRNIGRENMIGQATEGVVPLALGGIAKQIIKRIPGTMAYKAAREAGEKEVVALSRQSGEVLAAAADLEKEGLSLGMTLNQVQPDSPKINALVDTVKDSPQFINKQREFAEGYGEALKNTLNEITKRANPSSSPEGIGKTVVSAVTSLDKAEGRAIGEFKARALEATKNQKQPFPQEIQAGIKDLMDQFGFTYRATGDKITAVPPKDITSILGTKGLTKAGEVRSVINALNELGKTQSSGGARLTDLDRLLSVVGDLNPKLRGSAAGNSWGGLTGSLRQYRRDVIGAALNSPEDKVLFNRVMDDYANLRVNTEQLSNVLRGDVTSKTLVSSMFRGKENLANIRAIKSITGADSPEWGGLKEEFVNQLLVKHASDGPTGFNSAAFMKDLKNNYGDDFIKEVLDDGKAGPNYKTVQNLLTVGKRIEATQKGVQADTASEEIKKGIVGTAIGLLADVKFKTINGVSSILGATGSKESALMEILNRDGFEKYLAGYEGKDRAGIARMLERMQSVYNSTRASHRSVEAVTDIGKDLVDVTKRAAKANTRKDYQDKGPIKSTVNTVKSLIETFK